MYTNPVRGGGNADYGSRTSVKVLTALALVAVLAVGCFVLMNDSQKDFPIISGEQRSLFSWCFVNKVFFYRYTKTL